MKNFLIFDIFNSFSEITHFCTTRIGGVSTGNFASFNITPYSADNDNNFRLNIQILSDETNIPTENFIFPFQTHEDKVLVIDRQFICQTNDKKKDELQRIDAIITNEKNICIGVTTADCVPVLLYDKNKRIIAVVHAGWRGTCARLVEKTISKMQETYESDSKDIYALIGPSISPEVYEVGSDLIAPFSNAGFEVNTIFSERKEKLFLDLWEANRQLLIKSGVPPSQIQVSGICTFSQYQNFFSARRLGINSGRMYSGIMLK